MTRAVSLLVSLASLAFLLLAGCDIPDRRPQKVSQSTNPGFTVNLLFEHEGCRVFRFNDGNDVYYADCSGSAAMNWLERRGKRYQLRTVTVTGARFDGGVK